MNRRYFLGHGPVSAGWSINLLLCEQTFCREVTSILFVTLPSKDGGVVEALSQEHLLVIIVSKFVIETSVEIQIVGT